MVQDTVEITVTYTVNKCGRCPMMTTEEVGPNSRGRLVEVGKCKKDKTLVLSNVFKGIHKNCPYRRKEEKQ